MCRGMWNRDERREGQGTGNRGQIEKWERADRVNKHSREVLSPCTGRGSVCVCVCVFVKPSWLPFGQEWVCTSQRPAPVSLWRPLCCPCVCMRVCMHVPVLKTPSLRGPHVFEHIKLSDVYLPYFCPLMCSFQRGAPAHMHTTQSHTDFRFHKRFHVDP